MTITQLEYILAVNRYRHFQKAANSCNITQPTLSMQISKLEEELNVIIFDRSKSPLMPTAVGKLILEQAKLTIKEYEKIRCLITKNQGVVEGELKLAVIPTVSPYLIPLFVEDFSKQYPNVKLIIKEHTTCEIVKLLVNDEIDAAIVSTPLKNNNIIERLLYYEPFCLFVSPENPLSKKKKIKDIDLNTEGLWLYKEGHCFHNQSLKICSSLLNTSDRKIYFDSGNMETLKNLVLRGKGHTLYPYIATINLPEDQKKMVRRFVTPEPTREISLIHSRSFLKEPIIDALEKSIIESLPKEIRTLKSDKINVLDII